MIDPRAIIDPSARLGADVSVGPYTIIGPDVEIGDRCWIGPHVVLRGPTRLGPDNRIYQFASVGEDTPALVYAGEPTTLEVGARNVIREGVTIHRGTAQDAGRTLIGDDNLLMAYAHVAHDCVVGDHCIFANNASISGHVRVGDHVNLGGYAGIPQRRRVGAHAMVGAMSLVLKDVPAFVSVSGNPAAAVGINVIGMERRGFDEAARRTMQRAYRLLYQRGLSLEAARSELTGLIGECPAVQVLIDSLGASDFGIVRPRRQGEPAAGAAKADSGPGPLPRTGGGDADDGGATDGGAAAR